MTAQRPIAPRIRRLLAFARVVASTPVWRRSAQAELAGRMDAYASPAYFEEYMRRERWRQRGYPEEWASRADLPLLSDARVTAVVHVYFRELVDELIGHLASIPVPFDLVVTNATDSSVTIDTTRLTRLRGCAVLEVENRGRDLWPLAQVVNAGLLDRTDLVLKVHTKRSDWRDAHAQLRGTGESWRSELLAALLGDPDNVSRILGAFVAFPDLGVVTADGSVLGPEFWGRNRPVAGTLLRRLGRELPQDELRFAAGSMYWSRSSILQSLKRLHLSSADFEDEHGQIDGTTAHALERVIGLLTCEVGLRIVERSRIGDAKERSDRVSG